MHTSTTTALRVLPQTFCCSRSMPAGRREVSNHRLEKLMTTWYADAASTSRGGSPTVVRAPARLLRSFAAAFCLYRGRRTAKPGPLLLKESGDPDIFASTPPSHSE